MGSVCNPDRAFMEERFEVVDDENRMQQDVNFTNCSQALCLSVQGSSPFCTIPCQSDAACPADFRCEAAILTGPFACGELRFTEQGNTCEGTEEEDFIRYCSADPAIIAERQGISVSE